MSRTIAVFAFVVVVLVVAATTSHAQTVRLSAATISGADSAGAVIPEERWNTGPFDAAWDTGLYEGTTADAGNGIPEFFNDPVTCLIDADGGIALSVGETRTFTMAVPHHILAVNGFYAVNLFFDGLENQGTNGVAGISVFAFTDVDGPDVGDAPEFFANDATNTMGWPIPDTTGSGSLLYENCFRGVAITMTDFVVYSQLAFNGGAGFDVVQIQDPNKSISGTDGMGDFFAEFTLEVTAIANPETCEGPFIYPSELSCDRPQIEIANLSWTLNGAYDSIAIVRNGDEIAVLAGDATSYTDNAVPIGNQTYQVIATSDSGGPSCTVEDSSVVQITAMTFYGADVNGNVDVRQRWNTLWPDPAWDIAVYEGGVITDQDNVDPGDFLNSESDLGVTLRLLPGDTTYGFSVANSGPEPISGFYGLHLFMDGQQDPGPGIPSISVFVENSLEDPDGDDLPDFQPNGSSATMGWPIANTAGSNSVVYNNCNNNLRVELIAFQVFDQSSLIGVDLVTRQEPGGVNIKTAGLDGFPDMQGQFTLRVTELGEGCVPILVAPRALQCSIDFDGGVVNLNWNDPQTYDRIRILLNGEEIAELDGSETSFTDLTLPPTGDHAYEVIAVLGDQEGGPSCGIRILDSPTITAASWNRINSLQNPWVNPAERWNTLWPDDAWDIGVAEGDFATIEDEFDAADPPWLNRLDDLGITIPLAICDERTFTIAVCGVIDEIGGYNVNLFFNSRELDASNGNGRPDISVFAEQTEFGDLLQEFNANSNVSTMGWPIADTAGSGTLAFDMPEFNARVEMTEFVVFQKASLGGGAGVDFGSCQTGSINYTAGGPDGLPDLVAQFTLEVTSIDGSVPCVQQGGTPFRRGDHDGSGIVDITDPLNLLGFLFLGTTPPICADASDGDNSAALDISDALNLLGFLFLGSFPLNETLPGPMNCGQDPDVVIDPDGPGGLPEQPVGSLGCDTYPSAVGLLCP